MLNEGTYANLNTLLFLGGNSHVSAVRITILDIEYLI